MEPEEVIILLLFMEETDKSELIVSPDKVKPAPAARLVLLDISIELSTAILPNPKLLLAVLALARSDRLLALASLVPMSVAVAEA